MRGRTSLENHVSKLLRRARRFRRFPVSILDMHRFLSFLYQAQPIDLWALIRQSEMYIRVALSLLYVLEKDGFISVADDGKLRLTKQGLKLTRHLSAGKKIKVWARPKAKPRFNSRFKDILNTVSKLHQQLTPQNIYDQAPILPQSAVCKVAYAISKGDANGKSVVCIGDDDLTSIILALSGAPKRILAIDIDKYLLEMIEEYSEKNGLGIETLRHDLKKPVPLKYKNGFDLFITEPPDTVDGITLFVSRGAELLRNTAGVTGYCGISPTACPPLGLLEIQKNLSSMGFLVTDRLPKYSDYPPHRTELKHVEVPDCYDAFYPPDKVWYSADLLRLKTTIKTAPLIGDVFRGSLVNYRGDSQRYQ